MSLKLFQASYSVSLGLGYYQNYECVVTANNYSEALGLVLDEYEDTSTDGWSFEEISTTESKVTRISERS